MPPALGGVPEQLENIGSIALPEDPRPQRQLLGCSKASDWLLVEHDPANEDDYSRYHRRKKEEAVEGNH